MFSVTRRGAKVAEHCVGQALEDRDTPQSRRLNHRLRTVVADNEAALFLPQTGVCAVAGE